MYNIQGWTGAKKSPRQRHLKSLIILEKVSISLKKSSKIIESFYKCPTFLNRSLHFFGNVFKIVAIAA
jgi:hypothetical protein